MMKCNVVDQYYNFNLENTTLTMININTGERFVHDFSKEEIFKYFENPNRLA